MALSKVATLDVLATVLEEMPPFPEKESCGLLNLLKKKRPGKIQVSWNIWAMIFSKCKVKLFFTCAKYKYSEYLCVNFWPKGVEVA